MDGAVTELTADASLPFPGAVDQSTLCFLFTFRSRPPIVVRDSTEPNSTRPYQAILGSMFDFRCRFEKVPTLKGILYEVPFLVDRFSYFTVMGPWPHVIMYQ